MRLWANPMNRIEEITAQVTAHKWLEPFHQLLDEIYYAGYAEKLADENPEAFNLEYWYFLELYV